MQIRKRLLAMLFAVLLVCAACVSAYAHDVPDLSRTGSITVKMHQGDMAISGGTLTIYRVGDVQEDDGNYGFALTSKFAQSGVSLENVESPELAVELAQYAQDHDIAGTNKTIDANGKVSFTELELGLYLMVQNKAAEGYEAVEPFLVSVPLMEDGVYLYNVDASPKVSELVEREETEDPEEPVKPVKPSKPSTPSTSTLPQTGQLNWPVPLLAALGLGLFSMGWVLRFGKKGGYEK